MPDQQIVREILPYVFRQFLYLNSIASLIVQRQIIWLWHRRRFLVQLKSKVKKGLKDRGDSIILQNGNITNTLWQDMKPVLVITNNTEALQGVFSLILMKTSGLITSSFTNIVGFEFSGNNISPEVNTVVFDV